MDETRCAQMVFKVREAIALVPACAGWSVEPGFGPLDRLQTGPSRFYVTVTPGDDRVHCTVTFLPDDLEKGPEEMATWLLKASENLKKKLEIYGFDGE